jgi:hypothetical protein
MLNCKENPTTKIAVLYILIVKLIGKNRHGK